MKRLALLLLVFLPVMVWAEKNESAQTNVYEATGTYTYSTDPSSSVHSLTGYDSFTKMACAICITLDALPNGMYYEWKLITGNGDETFQPQPGNSRVCYIGVNGNTDVLRFSVVTRSGSGFQGIVAERNFTFRFY